MSEIPPHEHHAEVVRLLDGRWEVRCPECQHDETVPVGISLPVVNRAEAEGILRNHAALKVLGTSQWDGARSV